MFYLTLGGKFVANIGSFYTEHMVPVGGRKGSSARSPGGAPLVTCKEPNNEGSHAPSNLLLAPHGMIWMMEALDLQIYCTHEFVHWAQTNLI